MLPEGFLHCEVDFLGWGRVGLWRFFVCGGVFREPTLTGFFWGWV
jgi:hypothetical protein